MTLLPLSCFCVIVWVWSVSCLPATMEHNSNAQARFGTDLLKVRHGADDVTKARYDTDDVTKARPRTYKKFKTGHTTVPSIGVAWYPCGDGQCVCNATYADCNLKPLRYIPKFPPGVTSVDFSHNTARNRGSPNFFDNITDVVWLAFSAMNDFIHLYLGSFGRMTHLSFLDLTLPVISCDSLSSIFKIPSLQVLRLNYGKGCQGLEFLNITSPITRLRELRLTGRAIYPYVNLSYLSPFTGLRRLIIELWPRGAEIVMLSALHTMNLTYVDMRYPRLSCEDVATLLATPSLQELTLVENVYCEKFDFSLTDRSTNMTTLVLNMDEISEISNFSLPAGLKHLDVSHNRIMSVEFLSGLPYLQVLKMERNVMKYAPLVCHPTLEQLDLSRNGMNEYPFQSLTSFCLPNLTKLNVHGNGFRLDSLKDLLEKFRYFRSLEVLDISGQNEDFSDSDLIFFDGDVRMPSLKSINLADNDILFHLSSVVPADTFLSYPNLVSLSLANNAFGAVSEERFLQLFGHLVHLQHLSLSSTGLRFISPAMFRNFRALISIDLSDNSLSIVPTVVTETKHLAALDLSSNKISFVQESMFPYAMRRRLQHVDFSDNPLTCSCDMLWFMNWLLTSPSVFAHSSSGYICGNLPDTPITSFPMTEQACLLSQETSRFIIATVSLIFLGLSSLTFVYRYRWHIRLVLHEIFRGNDERVRHLRRHRFQYDVFVCYDSMDFPWVSDYLMPSLEEGMGLKLCIHQRDFIPGTPIVDNIEDSVVASKKMLMLFSRQFAQSPWCQFELRLCLTHAMDTQDVLIVVLLEDIPSRELTSSMMAVMRTKTYIEWADEAEARDCFWRRVGLALHEVLPGARV